MKKCLLVKTQFCTDKCESMLCNSILQWAEIYRGFIKDDRLFVFDIPVHVIIEVIEN